MESILHRFYEDGLEPSDRPQYYIAERTALKEKRFKLHEEFFETLNDKQKKQFNTLLDQIYEDMCYADCESYINGFQLGARVLIDVFTLPAGKA